MMPATDRDDRIARGVRAARAGIVVGTLLAVLKLIAGIVGHTYALVADAIESATDVLSSSILLGGLRVAGREPDEDYPFGYGKAESLAAAVVALLLCGAAVGVAIAAIREVRSPRDTPAWWTLVVLAAVLVIKAVMFKRIAAIGRQIGSRAVQGDALHHMSDALTSAAAFVGILIALIGGRGWESADDWAALAASCVILFNGVSLLRPAVADLMDRSPDSEVVQGIRTAATQVSGVLAIEKLAVRRLGMQYRVIVHVQADPLLPLRGAHALGGEVSRAIHRQVREVQSVVVHMEPFE